VLSGLGCQGCVWCVWCQGCCSVGHVIISFNSGALIPIVILCWDRIIFIATPPLPPYHRTTVQRTQGQLWTTMETNLCCRDQQQVEGTLPANGGTRVHVFLVQQKRNETGLVDRPSFLGSSAVKHAVAVSFSVASVASLLLPPTFAVASFFSFRVHPHPNAFSFAS
jgi:hypothetical protein